MTQRHKIPCFSSKMKSSSKKHTQSLIVTLSLLLLFSPVIPTVGAQSGSNESGSRSGNQEYYARFSPSMAIIIAVLVTALFFMGFFSIYIRRCADTTGGSVRPIISMRRRAAASRGLDAEVIQTFPTFAYDVVKDLNIGKGALECAVCLNEFEENETLRLIPKCDHVFHPECIDAWLASHVTCPVCRANLVPQPGEATQESDESNHESDHELDNNQQNGDVSIRISDENNYPQVPPINRNFSSKSRSIVPGFFERFRSHSTGHSLVQPGENVDRFTLRLPADVRKQVIKRALLNRTASDVVVLPREGSSRRGFRTGEGSNRGRSYRRLESLDRVVRSERWAKLPSFLSRALSIKSPKVKGESSTAATADHALLHSGRLKSDDARPVSANSTVPPV